MMDRFRIKVAGFRLLASFGLAAILLLMVPALGQMASAQQVRAYLSADSVRVGDRFSLTLVAEHTFVENPIFPGLEAGEAFYGDLEVLAVQGMGSRLANEAVAGTRIDSLIYEVATFALDTAYVPSIPVLFVIAGDTSFFASRPLELPIISLVPESAEDIRDLAPIAEFPINPWPWVLGVLLLIVLAVVGYFYWKRYAASKLAHGLKEPELVISPLEEAIERLRSLEKSFNLQEITEVKPFYVELTEILRVYFSRRLHINAMESTSQELMWDLESLARREKITQDAAYLTKRVLQVADLVKFADMHPAPDVGHQAFREARKVLDEVEEALKLAEQAVQQPVPAPATAQEITVQPAGAVDDVKPVVGEGEEL